MALVESNMELNQLLERWEREPTNQTTNPVPLLQKIAELIEKETAKYLKMDPDPFDDRHPSRAQPDCSLGLVLKTLFKNDDFMNKLVNNYVMSRDDLELQTTACRLMLDILPGLETSVVFNETEGLVDKLFSLAENSKDPLRSYATGLLAAAMEVPDIAVNYKELNFRVVPIMLKRLRDLNTTSIENNQVDIVERPFAHLSDSKPLNTINEEINEEIKEDTIELQHNKKESRTPPSICGSPTYKRRRLSSPSFTNVTSPTMISECSNSSWADLEPFMIGTYQMYPLTPEIKQRFILQYLTPMGDYQELLCHVFEQNALSLILNYINFKINRDIRLSFDALKYLASLLCHKKFALEFLRIGGLQQLLQVYRPSIAATGVSVCLYYLAYSEDAMEKICLLPHHVLSDLVNFALWLLECSHDSSRCHATMFFSLTFAFKVILKLFDAQDGLRKLLNVMFLLNILSDENDYTDDELFTKRQTARHVCVALKRYYEAHLVIEVEQLRNSSNLSPASNIRFNNTSTNIQPYKAARYKWETIIDYVEYLLEIMPLRINWKPVDELLKLGGVKTLISLVAVSFDWVYSGKAETVKSVLDVLMVCTVTPKFQSVLTENVQIDGDHNTVAMRIIFAAAEGEVVSDPEVQKSALHVIINCVCGPFNRIGGSIARYCSGSAKKRVSFRSNEDLLTKMWNCIRVNNGIMVLLNLLMIKTPISDADAIRALACKSLCGLARSETTRQIISKLPLFTNGQLQGLMKEPILQDKRTEHVKFCKYCMELIQRITGTPVPTNIDTSPANINKAEVVAQTRIVYNDKELLQLMHQHLLNKGLLEAATALQKEANLPNLGIKVNPTTHWTPTSSKRIRPIATAISPYNSNNHSLNQTPGSSLTVVSSNALASGSQPASVTTPVPPIRIHRHPSVNKSTPQVKVMPLQKPDVGCYQPSPVLKKIEKLSEAVSTQLPTITLDSIVTEYLRKQHALCKNPVVTCPPFDLFIPHRCPEPLNRNAAPLNMTLRLQKRQIFPRFGGLLGPKFDRRFIYSRFKTFKTFRDTEGASSFSSVAFSHSDKFLFLGSVAGDLSAYNLHTGALDATYSCHESELTYIEPSNDGRLIITCSLWRPPLSILWTFTDVFEMKMSFGEDHYVEFGKHSQDKVLGTKYSAANLYDLTTAQLVTTFEDENLSNKYSKNRATFSYTDELVLNDGVLWDVRSASSVHKFDKFNQSINGVFHPNCREIISNSEIWDLRTYHLLKTVSALDQCHIKFNLTGDVMYGAMFEEEISEEEEHSKSPYGNSFRTFDAIDYTNIATIDVKRNIYDLAVDPGNCFIALVENQSSRDSIVSTESVCKLYEVGRCKEEDDEEAEDDDEEENDDDMGDDDDTDEDNIDHDENTDDINHEDSNDSDNMSSLSHISLSDQSTENISDLDNNDDEDDEDIFFQINEV